MLKRPLDRSTVIIVIVFVALVGVFGWQWYQQQQQTETAQQAKDFLSFDVASVTDITVVQGDTTVTLQKQTDQWVITSKDNSPIEADTVETMLSTLNNALIQATVSTTETSAADYDLTSETAVHVTASANGTTTADVLIGKAGVGTRTWYGRKVDSDTIYLLSGSRNALLPVEPFPSADTTDTFSTDSLPFE